MLMEIRQKFERVTEVKVLASVINELLEHEHPFDQQKEHFFALGLNTKHELRYVDLVTLGVLDASLVHPREVFRHAVAQGVSAIALAHNHPSGTAEPSAEDYAVTERMVKSGKTLGISVLDHMIVGNRTTTLNHLS